MISKHGLLGLTMAVMMSVSMFFPAYAELIKDSYIVAFKNPVGDEPPLIEPPNKANSGKVPFGENSTGQSKAELAAKLNLREDQILSIFETINAILVSMTPEEAFRLSIDSRVLYIEPDQTTAPAGTNPVGISEASKSSEYPSYQNGILTIPCVDTPEQPCMVQDAKFQYTEQGDWRLTDLKVFGISPSWFAWPYIDSVETIVTDTFPVQVFLKVKGDFPVMGPVIGRIPQRFKDNRFYVYMYATGSGGFPMAENFEKIIPLSVYGLSAGTYEYSLSGVCSFSPGIGCIPKTFTGTFVLARDNKF